MIITTKPSREIAVVGRACRLPGSNTIEQLWSNLLAGTSSVTRVPEDRWSLAKHGHPRPKEPGKSYIWSAGVLDDVWSFDPAVFGISPREAEQMDPQQRLLLELTWEALEDAGIKRNNVAGTEVGVFVGASSTEYQNIRNTDMAAGDAYTATGAALSIISNRVSHAFDLRGPSFTVDTACSSSLVALHQAMEAIRSGSIDTAIVGGVNLLLSPFGFVIFSQASMLSPTGLCRTFDAKADGYVRAEGGVVLVLKSMAKAAEDNARVHGTLVASGVNSDGRTNGIALPSRHSQTKLLRDVYGKAGISPSDVAFVEAHGTGTRVGDPIEATTIGDVLGQGRTDALKIGSIKSNIGHLEPASGLAGVLKALLALEHDILPPSLHFDDPNPEIPFGELNLEVCAKPMPLPRNGSRRFAGVNSFGFGGTNAHVVIGDAPARPARPKRTASNSDLLAISAESKPAVRDLARRFGERLSSATFEEAREIVAAAAHRRDMLSERAVIEWGSPRDLARKLERIADKDDVPGVTWGTVAAIEAPVAFVFSGNGSQWPGMGRDAYGMNRRFRETFDEIDALFDSAFGWSITEALFANDLEQRLRFTHIAQPLVFAIQIAVARALAAEGLEPTFVLGHSVGEIAAATISGALTLAEAVRVIQARSTHQELARDAGRMAVLVASRDKVEALCEDAGDVEIAAENSARNFTVAGPTDAIAKLGGLARKRRIVFRQLDLDYPFHCRLIDPVRAPLLRDLKGLKSKPPKIEMISTVTGETVAGSGLDAEYWWRNVREPVQFSAAVETAAALGARVFVEIGPHSVLLSTITETLEATALPFAALGVLDRRDPNDRDPIRPGALSAFTRGAAIDVEKLFGPEPSLPVHLPSYPWQRRDMRAGESPESVGFTLDTRWHRLAGGRNTPDGVEWLNLLDTIVLPELADHEVGGHAILPGAAFIEIALAVGREAMGASVSILELDIMHALPLERDRTRELKTRFSPATNTLEILSRPRLSRAGWTTHAAARLSLSPEEAMTERLPDMAGDVINGDAVYRAAEAVGLRYGPHFRLLTQVVRIGERQLFAELGTSEPAAAYGIDPARLDACFHGLFALLGDLDAGRRGTAYIPVRFGHIRLTRAGAIPVAALIDIDRLGEGSILADFTLFDEHGTAIGHLHDARFQAARVQRANVLAEKALVQEVVALDRGAAGAEPGPASTAAIWATARRLDIVADAEDAGSAEQLLLDGWAAAAGLEIARSGLASAAGDRAGDDGLEPSSNSWLANILRSLEESGLATEADGLWSLAGPDDLPPSEVILRTIAADHPDRSAELLLAGRLTFASGVAGHPTLPSAIAIDGFELGGASVRRGAETIARLVDATGLLRPDGLGLRILQVGYGPLSHGLEAAAADAQARLTVFDPDIRRTERARLGLRGGHVAFAETVEALSAGSYDLVVSSEGLHRLGASGVALSDVRRAMAPGAVLIAVEPGPSLFRDVVFGMVPGWFEEAAPAFPLSPLRSGADWVRDLKAAGFDEASSSALVSTSERSSLIVASLMNRGVGKSDPRAVTIVRDGSRAAKRLGEYLDARLGQDGHDVRLNDPADASAQPDVLATTGTCLFVMERSSSRDDRASIRDGCLKLKSCAERCSGGKGELWLIASATRGESPLADPVVVAMMAFARTLANEIAPLTVRRIAIAASVTPDRAADAVRLLVSKPQVETDFMITPAGVKTLRVSPLREGHAGPPHSTSAAKLERGVVGGLGALRWTASLESEPERDEVEVEVDATGLNFRDVMWAMSLLPDDILEDGFAGPTLGLECAGRVRRTGSAVNGFRPGDRVLAFAPSAFSTSTSVPASVVAHIPDGWSTEAAASVPVAFLTAYYGLLTLGGLKAGDWVLVHGAAGGVGLAAIQIAQWRGAHVIATAGSPEKHGLLRALGVEHVLNSRSSSFADDVRRIRRVGVDIVLNSLSGEAMERGLSTLRPFGRFIELGKRDYVANTRIGLRPFRRNLSYFGVDVDQLLSDRDRASAIFAEIMRLFEAGDLKPLPYRVFSADETVDAFRLMQQSGHVGKIVLRPPTSDRVGQRARPPFAVSPDRTHLVTGGFGGFGLETARWLADQGARHIVLLGRSGPQSEEAQALVQGLEDRGLDVMAGRCDVADPAALAAVFRDIASTMPPLAGILHAAMVLEDGLIAGLTSDQLDRVLAPKIAGAALLDSLTAKMKLDYFVMFSSITTVIGNPGQGAYVAANGYLEGLARLRRERGQPGLALAWGAISDVGVLARQQGLAEALSKRVGVKAMPAREALDLMAQALSNTGTHPDLAVLAIGSLDWNAARRLPALDSPTFAALMRDGSVADASERTSIDLKALIAAQPSEVVRKRVVEVIIEEIATVLRIPKQEVSPTKRLSEIGLDSLMAIELATALQDRLELDTPPSGSVGAMTTAALADHLIGFVDAGHPDEEVRVTQALNERHAGIDLDNATLSPVVKAAAARSRELKGLTH